jgi:hypothetical protein
MFLTPRSGDDPLALDDPYQNGHDGQNQQNVDEPTKSGSSGDAQEPQNKQNEKNSPEHVNSLFLSLSAGLQPRRSG